MLMRYLGGGVGHMADMALPIPYSPGDVISGDKQLHHDNEVQGEEPDEHMTVGINQGEGEFIYDEEYGDSEDGEDNKDEEDEELAPSSEEEDSESDKDLDQEMYTML
jgi:hypothetical protein